MIGPDTFSGCKSLWEVSWNPVKLTSNCDGIGLFKNAGLRKINFGPNVKELPGWMLYDCPGLINIELPESLERIGDGAIRACSGLTYIRIPDNVEYIGADAFWDCKRLEKITIGKNVKTIGTSAFRSLPALKIVEWNANNVEMDRYQFNEPTQLTDFIVGNDVKILPEKICYNASSLKNVVLGESLEEIPAYAFCGCKSLESISFPNSLLKISDSSFAGTSLTELVIPENMKTIEGFNAFSNVPIKNIFFTSTRTPSFSYNTFPETVSFYVLDHDKYTSENYREHAALYKPYAVADKTLFTADDTDFSVNFTCNIPDYTMEIVNMPELSREVGEHSAAVEAKFSGTSEFTVPFVYNYKVDPGAGISAANDSMAPQVVGRYNLYGLPIGADYSGIIIIRYSDGSVKKEIKNPTSNNL